MGFGHLNLMMAASQECESFSRERSTTVSKQEGAGLGLAIVKKDVDRSLAAGMNAHAVKPIDVKNLFETIQRLVKE